jgi:hypothetical protein
MRMMSITAETLTMIIMMITNGEKVRILARVLFYNAKIATNILATDLGVIAKRRKQIVFVCRNIVTTEPVTNARVDLYTFQQQKITTGTE